MLSVTWNYKKVNVYRNHKLIHTIKVGELRNAIDVRDSVNEILNRFRIVNPKSKVELTIIK